LHQIEHMEFGGRMLQQKRQIHQSLAVPEACDRTAEGDCPIVALAALLLVLDDLHWADESTLALLNFLAHRVAPMKLVLIGTYRDLELDRHPALTRTLEELIRIGIRPLTLKGLPFEAVAQMLRVLAQHEPPESLARLIFRETEGNPFFVEEVYRHLAEEGKLYDEAGNFRADVRIDEIDVPDNIKLVLGRRLDRLSPASRRILSAAAVIGTSFSLEMVQALSGLHDAGEVLTAMEEAERMGLAFAPSNDPAAPFSFAHELVRQMLLATMSGLRRRQLHLMAADGIEALYPNETGVRAADIANHLIAAGQPQVRQKAARYLAIAGRNALGADAYEEARRHFETALSFQKGADAASRAQLLLDVATADRGLGNWDAALARWKEAVDLYAAAGDSGASGCVFFEMFEGLVWSGRGDAAQDLARRGLDGLKEDPANRAYLATVNGLVSSLNGHFEQARPAFEEALSTARALHDCKLVARIQAYWSITDFYFMQLSGSLENGSEAAELAQSTGAPWSRAIASSRVQVALNHLGRTAEADAVGRELEPLARKLGHFAALSFCIWTQAWTRFGKDGDLAQLERRLAEDREINQTAKVPLLLAPTLAQFSVIEFLRANRSGALEYADQARALSPFSVMRGFGTAARLRQMAYAGEHTGALAILEESRAMLPQRGAVNTIGSWAMLLSVVEGLFVLGERKRAVEFYPAIRELIGTGAVCLSWIARFPQTVAGIAAAAARNWSAAEEHFALAKEQARKLPHRLEAADVNRFHATMLIERGARRDMNRARRLLTEALDSYEKIGMPRHAEMTRALASRVSSDRIAAQP
jgi:tetratricopeptide (TPR) repeat protein